MYKLKTRINNLKHSFAIHHSSIIYSTKSDEIIIKDVDNELILFKIIEKSSGIGITLNTFHYSDYNNFISNTIDLKTCTVHKNQFLYLINNEKYILVKKRTKENNYLILLDNNLDVIWEKKRKIGKNRLLNNKNIFLTEFLDDTLLTCLSTLSSDFIWQLNLAKLFKPFINHQGLEIPYNIDRIIDVYNNQLLISCNNHLILSVDTNTGKLIHKWQEIPNINVGEIEGLIPDASSFVLDKNVGKLIGAIYKYYFEIDLETKEISYKDISEEFKKHNIISIKNITGSPITETHMYLTALTEQEIGAEVVGDYLFTLNRKTLKIDWIYKFNNKGFLGANKPQISDNKLYQLDVNGTLHVFEKQETTTT